MITLSRKEITEALKWSRKNSAIAHLVLSMNGKWGVAGQNVANVCAVFLRCWPAARAEITTQARMNPKGRLQPAELTVNFPNSDMRFSIKREFFDILRNISRYFDEADDYGPLESFSRDMLSLFQWEDEVRETWLGNILYAMDKEDKTEEAYAYYMSLEDKGAGTASMYALSLLDRCDTEKAGAVLEPFRESGDETIRERIVLLDRLKAVKGPLRA